MLAFLPDLQQPESSSGAKPPDVISQQGRGARGAAPGTDGQDQLEDPSPVLLDGLHSLAEAEKLFDELTQEKLQVGLAECGRTLCRSSSHAARSSCVNQGINCNITAQEVFSQGLLFVLVQLKQP